MILTFFHDALKKLVNALLGTGKTTVGRVIADVLFGLDLMPSSKFIETSALDLTGDYVGQTKTKVGNILKEGKGGIVFIDEGESLLRVLIMLKMTSWSHGMHPLLLYISI